MTRLRPARMRGHGTGRNPRPLHLPPAVRAQGRAAASRGRMLETWARAGLCTPGCRDWATQAVLHWIADSFSNVKRATARLPLRPQEPQRRRDTASVLVLVDEQSRRVPALCVASPREGQSFRGIAITDAAAFPERCRPVAGLPPPGTGGTGRFRASTTSSALRRTRGCAGVHRARIPRGSPILARGGRRQAPRRRTGAASCLRLLRGR